MSDSYFNFEFSMFIKMFEIINSRAVHLLVLRNGIPKRW